MATPLLLDRVAGDGTSVGREPAGHPRRQRGGVGRRSVWLAAAVPMPALLWSAEPLTLALVSFMLTVMVSAAIAPSRSAGSSTVVAVLPAGFTLVIAWALAWGLAGGAASVGTWATRWAGLCGIILLALVTGLAVWRRSGRLDLVGWDRLGAAGFVLLAAFFAVIVATLPLARWARMNSIGSDFLRHLGLIQEVRGAGYLVPGEVTYPRALHALVSWLSSGMGIPAQVDPLWRSVAPLQFLMLGLMLLAVMVVADRVSVRVSGSVVSARLAAVIAAAAFLQTAWFDTFLSMGNLMNLIVGVALLGMLSYGGVGVRRPGLSGWLVASASVAVVANAWQLLVVVAALGCAPALVDFLRHGLRRPAGWAVWAAATLVTVHGLGIRPAQGRGVATVRSSTSQVSLSLLDRPEWWWWAAIAVSLLAAAWVFVAGGRAWALSYLGMCVGAAATLAVLLWSSGSGWDRMLYYPAKALWTSMVVVVPMAAAGAAIIVRAAWVRASRLSRPISSGLRGAIVLALVLALAGVAGRGAAFPPHLVALARGGPASPAWSLAVIDALGSDHLPGWLGGARVIVFGIVPGADVTLASSTYPGIVDYTSMEALSLAGFPGARDDPIKAALLSRDTAAICRFLEDNPEAVRITGPNPDAGPWWLVGAGCPVNVVEPEAWVSLRLGAPWLEVTPWEGTAWSFPRFDEVFPTRPIGGI